MIQINLLPVRETRRKEDLRQQGMQLLLVLILVGAVIAFFHSRIGDQIAIAQNRVQQMQKDIDKFKPQLDQVASFRKKKAALEKKIDIIEGLDRARRGPVRMLDELATHTPERLWLETLETKGQEIHLKGASLDNELVAAFLGALGESEYFDEVDLNKTVLESNRQDLKVVSFTIDAMMTSPEEKKAEEKGAKPAEKGGKG